MRFKKVRFSENKSICKDKNKILSYLKNKKIVGAIPGGFKDPFTNKKILGNNIYSDGVYEWGDDLHYLLTNYDVDVDKEFINHVLEQK